MKKIIILSAIIVAFCSCAKENFNPSTSTGMRQLTVIVGDADEVIANDDETKAWTYHDTNKEGVYRFRWNSKNEKVSVFDSKADIAGGHIFDATPTTQPKVTMSGEICQDATGQVVFMTPYQNNEYTAGSNNYKTNYDVANKKITSVEIPYHYSVREPHYLSDRSLNRIGVLSSWENADKEQVNLYNPFAAVVFTLTNGSGHNIKQIELIGNLGEKLAGFCSVNISEPKNPKVEFLNNPVLSGVNGQRVAYDIVLNKTSVTASPTTYFVDGTYLTSLAPVNFTKGLMLKFIDDKGNVAFKGASKALKIDRNHLKNLGTIDVSKLDWHFAVDLRFLYGTYIKSENPFKETIKQADATHEKTNTVYTYTHTIPGTEVTVPFKMYCPDKKVISTNPDKKEVAEIGWYNNGLNIKGYGAYLEIPAIEGKVLKRIFLRLSSTGAMNGNPCIVRVSDGKYLKTDGTFAEGNPKQDDNADIWRGKMQFGYYKQWTKGFEAGESYRIQLTEQITDEGHDKSNDIDGMKILNLVLLYDDATKATALTTPQVNDWGAGAETGTLMY